MQHTKCEIFSAITCHFLPEVNIFVSFNYGGREGPSIATSIWRFFNGTMQWKISMEAHNGSAYIIDPKVTLSLVIGAPHLGQHAV